MTTTTRIAAVAVSVLLAALCGGVSGQASPPTPDCMTYLLNASDCLTYVSPGSNLTKPDRGCCPELAGLVDGNPVCLCYLLSADNSFGLQIDTKRALNLPSLCSVTAPPVSLCSEIGMPVGAPTSSEEMAPEGAPSSSQHSMPPGAASPGGSSTSGASSSAGSALSLLLIFTVPIAFVKAISFC